MSLLARLRIALIAVVAIFGLGATVLMVYVFLYLAESTSNIRETLKTSVATQQTINDCIDPDGKCNAESQRQQVQFLTILQDGTILAISCADKPGHQTPDQIKKCVERKQKKP